MDAPGRGELHALDLALSRCSQTLSKPGKVAGTAKAMIIPQGSQASRAVTGRSLQTSEEAREANSLTFTEYAPCNRIDILCSHNCGHLLSTFCMHCQGGSDILNNLGPSVLALSLFWL